MFILTVQCNMPPIITGILSQVYKAIIILVPIGIVLFGAIDFIKAVAAKDDSAISKNSKVFVSRLIAGALTFFILTIATWLFRTILGAVGGRLSDASSAMECAIKILGGETTEQEHDDDTSEQDNQNCYSREYSNCIQGNASSNKESECRNAANKICGTSNQTTTKKTTTTNNINNGGQNMGGGGAGGRR